MSEETRSKIIKKNDNETVVDKISGKISRQDDMVTATISAHMIFGDMCISVQTKGQTDDEFYDRAQKAIDFIKENLKDKENQYYG